MSLPSRYFRAGVGAVITNTAGLVLALERSDIVDAWQMPQGGWELDETMETAVYREVEEETGLTPDRLHCFAQYPEPLVYELPAERQTTKTGLGEVQYWFFLKLQGIDEVVPLPSNGEFVSWAWLTMPQIIQKTAPFRRVLYQRLQAHLQGGMSA